MQRYGVVPFRGIREPMLRLSLSLLMIRELDKRESALASIQAETVRTVSLLATV